MAKRRGIRRLPRIHALLSDLPRIDRKVVFGVGFLVFSAVVAILVVKMVRPFLDPLVWGAVLAILAYPLNHLLLRFTRGRRTLAAVLATILIALTMLGVTAFVGRSLLAESRQAYYGLRQALDEGGPRLVTERLARLPNEIVPDLLDDETAAAFENWLNSVGESALEAFTRNVGNWTNSVLSNASKFLLDLFVTVVAVFFLLREGEAWVETAKKTVPLSPSLRDTIIERFSLTFRAIVYGVLLGAVIEAALMTAGFFLFGVPLPVFLGVVTFFVVLIPFIGPPAVWIPVTAWLYFVKGDDAGALGFALYGGLVVVTLGSLIKPILIGTHARLPVFFVFVAILGGIMAFGAVGIILGPILLATAVAVARIFRELSAARAR